MRVSVSDSPAQPQFWITQFYLLNLPPHFSGTFCSILPELLKTDEISNLEVAAFW